MKVRISRSGSLRDTYDNIMAGLRLRHHRYGGTIDPNSHEAQRQNQPIDYADAEAHAHQDSMADTIAASAAAGNLGHDVF
jgi:hypothetical protein